MSDIITPRFHTLRNQGGIVNNPMEHSVITGFAKPYDVQLVGTIANNGQAPAVAFTDCRYKWLLAQNDASIIGDDFWSTKLGEEAPVISSMLAQQALTKALANADKSEMQSLVTIAEARQTARLMRTLGTRIGRLAWHDEARYGFANVLHHVGRLRHPSFYRRTMKLTKIRYKGYTKKALIKAANEWLQYRYGIRQILFDIQALTDACTSLRRETRTRFSATLEATPRTAQWTSDDMTSAGGSRIIDWNMKYSSNWTGLVTAGVLVEPKLGPWGTRFDDAFGLCQMLPTCWELTKYSFVIDWFVRVGDVVAAANLPLHKRVLTSWIVERSTENRTHTRNLWLANNWRDQVWNSWVGANTKYISASLTGDVESVTSIDIRKTKRTANPTWMAIPPTNVDIRPGNLADLVSLAAQYLRYWRT
jgi:hypothetical protein